MINLICVAVSGAVGGSCLSRGLIGSAIINFGAMLFYIIVVMEKL